MLSQARSFCGSGLGRLRKYRRATIETYYRTFYGRPRVFRVRVPGLGEYRLKLRLADGVTKVKRSRGLWEPEVKSIFRRLVTPGSTVLDVGAHVGDFTIEAALLAGSTGHVHAVEMIPAFHAILEENVALNGLDNVTTHLVGLADRRGTISVHDGYGYLVSPAVGGQSTAPRTVDVGVTTLDALCADLGLIDVIKIDVEGAEKAIFVGAHETLRRNRDVAIICEVHPRLLPNRAEDVAAIYGILLGSGFEIFLIPEELQWNPHILASRRGVRAADGLMKSTMPDELMRWAGL